jgi:hypothetical protein
VHERVAAAPQFGDRVEHLRVVGLLADELTDPTHGADGEATAEARPIPDDEYRVILSDVIRLSETLRRRANFSIVSDEQLGKFISFATAELAASSRRSNG